VNVEPYIEASIPGFDVMAKEIAGLRADVKALTTILMKPTVRTVTRDGDGRITSITDRRA
jgi:YD repeat-containing protein